MKKGKIYKERKREREILLMFTLILIYDDEFWLNGKVNMCIFVIT